MLKLLSFFINHGHRVQDAPHEPESWPVAEFDPLTTLFQAEYYKAIYPEMRDYGGDLLEHYLNEGWKEGKNPNPYFYTDWYRKIYSDAASSGVSPLEHYIATGAAKGYDPSPRFSSSAYRALYPEVGMGNPLAWHFAIGMRRGNINISPAIADRVIKASQKQYASPLERLCTVHFTPALPYSSRTHFDDSVAKFCSEFREKITSKDLVAIANMACAPFCSLEDGGIDFQHGIIVAQKALGGVDFVDSPTRAYFLFLLMRYLHMDEGIEFRQFVQALDPAWLAHPEVIFAVALWNLLSGDPEYADLRERLGNTYMQKFTFSLDLLQLELGFAKNEKLEIPAWFYDLSQYHCKLPFQQVNFLAIGDRIKQNFCCDVFSQTHINNLDEVVPAPHTVQVACDEFRRSITDGDFSYCNFACCPYIKDKCLPSAGSESDSKYEIILNLDETCNLKCAHCREDIRRLSKGQREKRKEFFNAAIMPLLEEHPSAHLIIDGTGEVLASKFWLDILAELKKKSNEITVTLCTNAQLFTPQVWDKYLSGLVTKIRVSVDASSAEVYESIRLNGKWDTLIRNMEFMASLAQKGIFSLKTCFIVQRKNYFQIVDFARLSSAWHAESIDYQRLLNSVNLPADEFRDEDALNPLNKSLYPTTIRLLKEAREFMETHGMRFYLSNNGA